MHIKNQIWIFKSGFIWEYDMREFFMFPAFYIDVCNLFADIPSFNHQKMETYRAVFKKEYIVVDMKIFKGCDYILKQNVNIVID